MQIKQSVDPLTETDEIFKEFKNTSGGTLAHGDVLVRDTAETSGDCMTTNTTGYHIGVQGVVYDPNGNSVLDDAVGVMLVKGFGKASITTASITAGTSLCHSTVAKQLAPITTSLTTLPNGMTSAQTIAELIAHFPGYYGFVVTSLTAAATATSKTKCWLDFTKR